MGERCTQVCCFSGSWRSLIFICLIVSGLLLSACSSTPVTSTQVNKPTPHHHQSGRKYHRVRKGDTLYAVSWKVGLDYKTLARWNGLRAPYTIYPGQKLRLTSPPRKNKATKTASKAKSKQATSTKSSPKVVESNSKIKSSAKKSPSSGTTEKKATPTGNAKLKWIWPARGKLVGTYSSKDPSRDGIKIAGNRGQKILSAEAGQVVYVGSGLVGYGRLIIIKHNKKFLSAYGHNSRLLVKEGDVVKKGKHIADMGLAYSGQAQLHFEIRKYGKPVNPVSYLP
jgi:lipoprotein NlpD